MNDREGVARPLGVQELRELSRQTRRLILRTVHGAQAGHLGGPLSVADILVALFFHTLNIRPAEPSWLERDRFVLSKGHSCVALYVVMALRGYFSVDELRTFDQIDSRLQGHPDMTRLGVLDMSTGSLGQGISAAVGMALGAKRTGATFRTWVVLGDGECQEGQVWEAALVAARYGLDNLVAIVDLNRLQQFGWRQPQVRDVDPLPGAAAKWAAFGWAVDEVDGHDFEALVTVLASPPVTNQPRVVLASTVKGKGVPFMEGDADWHAKPLSDEQLASALGYLDG